MKSQMEILIDRRVNGMKQVLYRKIDVAMEALRKELKTDMPINDIICSRSQDIALKSLAMALMQGICIETGYTLEDLRAQDRTAEVSNVRQRMMYELRVLGMTTMGIGDVLDRHHATVLSGIRQHAAILTAKKRVMA